MDLAERLGQVTVVGAAGKMGSGISLLLLQEMAFLKLAHPEKSYVLYLLDQQESALEGLVQYLQVQLTKSAERQIKDLREGYKNRTDLVENGEMIQEFVSKSLAIVRPAIRIENAQNSHLVFEAIVEREDVKVKLFQNLKNLCPETTYFFTNTSSIPIHVLEEKAQIQGRLIGYHFYNPPAVQKLVELIGSQYTPKALMEISLDLAKRLKKKIIPAHDIAGFIGNGHFIRDGLYAISEMRRLSAQYGKSEALYLVNKVSQDLLLRPMGIFQLIDYVGIDVFRCIQHVMAQYLTNEKLTDDFIEEMISRKVLGGQRSDGSQKDGFFQYQKGNIVGVYDFEKGCYLALEKDGFAQKLDAQLGPYPTSWSPWKKLLADAQAPAKISQFFHDLPGQNTLGASLALAYLQKSRAIAQALVDTKVAEKAEDVNGVLTTGFFHLYGPIHDFTT